MYKLKLIIYGKVQGVGFRFFAKEISERLNVFGFVKNQADGSLYIEAYGPLNNLKIFLKEILKGPSLAKIEKFEKNLESVTQIPFNDFKIIFE